MSKAILILLSFCVSMFSLGCATIYNPATEKKEIIFIDTVQEVAIGENVNKDVLKKYKIFRDEKTQKYVQGIGQRVAAASDRQDLKYHFTVLDTEELNAFALPGGNIYINKGLVGKLDEDEIACVLAHEVGHVAAKHSVKRMQGQIGYQLLMAIALYEINKKDERLTKTVAQGATTVFGLILLGYSREDELLADKLAIKYAHKSGYNPRGMVTSLKKLKQYSKEKTTWRPLVILRSHPYLEDRIRQAEAEVAILPD